MIIKKIGVIITSLIFIATLSLIPVKAEEIVSTDIDTYSPPLTDEEQKQITGAKYLVEYLRQGGSIDLTAKSPNYTAIDLIDDIADFFNGSIAQLFGDEGYWINNISDTQIPEYIYLKEPTVTSFIEFGINSLYNLTSESTTPEPNPDYLSYIQYINGDRFNISGYNFNPALNSEYTNIGCSVSYGNINGNVRLGDSQCTIVRFPTMSVYINGSNETNWIVTHSNYGTNESIGTTGWNQYVLYSINVSNLQNDKYTSFNGGWTNGYVTGSLDFLDGTFNSLQSAFEHVKRRYNKVNIYVNGSPWAIISEQNYHIDLGQGTYIDGTNQPIKYDYPEPTKIDLTDLIDRLDLLIANQNKIKFPDFSDLIVDENGQQAVAVVIVNKDLTVDDWYVTNYGTLIPLFPVFVDYPVNMTDITTIATIGVKDVIPTDILEILGIALVGMLFVTWIHRLLE